MHTCNCHYFFHFVVLVFLLVSVLFARVTIKMNMHMSDDLTTDREMERLTCEHCVCI